MEKLRATWVKSMINSRHKWRGSLEDMEREAAAYHDGATDAYGKVLRDSEWFNEEFSKLLAEVTEGVQGSVQARNEAQDRGYPIEAEIQGGIAKELKRIKDKLERLEQG